MQARRRGRGNPRDQNDGDTHDRGKVPAADLGRQPMVISAQKEHCGTGSSTPSSVSTSASFRSRSRAVGAASRRFIFDKRGEAQAPRLDQLITNRT